MSKQTLKLLTEGGPLIVFFASNWLFGFFWATGLFMAATGLALFVSWKFTGKIAIIPLVSAGFVAIFGGLTLYFHDETFIKVKVTIINAFFGIALLVGLVLDQLYIKLVMGEAMEISDNGWRKLQLRWALFFLSMAGINEYLWRNYSQDTWVTIKSFGFIALVMAFAIAQIPLMLRHQIVEKPEAKNPQFPS